MSFPVPFPWGVSFIWMSCFQGLLSFSSVSHHELGRGETKRGESGDNERYIEREGEGERNRVRGRGRGREIGEEREKEESVRGREKGRRERGRERERERERKRE